MPTTWRLRRVARFRAHVGCAWGAAWRPDGGLLATCGSDRRICLWAPDKLYAAPDAGGSLAGGRAELADAAPRGTASSAPTNSPEGNAARQPEKHVKGGPDRDQAPRERREEHPTDGGNPTKGDGPHKENRGETQGTRERGNRMSRSGGAEKTPGENGRLRKSEYPSWTLISVIDASATHTRTVRSVSFSPDGFWLAAASFDATVSVWCSHVAGVSRTPSRFTQVQVLEGPEHEVKCVAWSRTGRYLATCSRDKTVWIFESSAEDREEVEAFAASLRQGRRTRGSRRLQRSLGDAADGSSWPAETLEEDGRWDAAQNERDLFLEERRSDWPPPYELDVNMGDDGCFFVAAVLSGHAQDVKAVRWHPREDLCISASYDDTFRVWGLQGGAGAEWGLLQVVKAHSSTVLSLAFDRLGSRLATCSDDRHLKIWTCLNPQLAHATGGSSAATSPRSLLASASAPRSRMLSEELTDQAAWGPLLPLGETHAEKREEGEELESGSKASWTSSSPTSTTATSGSVLSSRILPPWYVTSIFRGATLGDVVVSPSPAGPADTETGPEETHGDNGDIGDTHAETEDRGRAQGSGEVRGDAAERRSNDRCRREREGKRDERQSECCEAESFGASEKEERTPQAARREEAEKSGFVDSRGGEGEEGTDLSESESDKERNDKEEIRQQQPDKWRPEAALLSDIHTRPVYFVDWHATLDIIVTACGDNALRFFSAEEDEEGARSWGLLLSKPDAHYSDINCAVWNPVTPACSRRSEVLLGNANAHNTAALLASVDDDGKMAIWSLERR
ncbi:WD domain, G-beta repeat-containing protein [Toxoplasma gondii GAB2-2007-GAL-DOM2]|uniref:Probable cytosolic iron-sulfur protein assembly protein CIAO1 homolog n=4 Tax=Toxoplasma gondii TaxID=5811 RepID=A0A2T6J214_TOXGO|nr:WD domain, G-beta repeat-containing protein [Toxoplasma gondii GAB2-2007-GAL-DOM2]PUA91619.1 WD domain, G-beta repeat-containing protein [Toxoplasma gondii TgCATBr9]